LTFEEPKLIREDTSEDNPYGLPWKGCPFCGGDYYAIIKCETCETEIDPIPGDYRHINGYGDVCPNCQSYLNVNDCE
jgi:hypothetical protein